MWTGVKRTPNIAVIAVRSHSPKNNSLVVWSHHIIRIVKKLIAWSCYGLLIDHERSPYYPNINKKTINDYCLVMPWNFLTRIISPYHTVLKITNSVYKRVGICRNVTIHECSFWFQHYKVHCNTLFCCILMTIQDNNQRNAIIKSKDLVGENYSLIPLRKTASYCANTIRDLRRASGFCADIHIAITFLEMSSVAQE